MTTSAIKRGDVPLDESELDAAPAALRLLRSFDPEPVDEVVVAAALAVVEVEALEVEVEVAVEEEEEEELLVLVDAEAVETVGSLRAALEGFAFPETTGWCCRTGCAVRVSPQRARHSSVPS